MTEEDDARYDDLTPEEIAESVASLEAQIREALLLGCPELEPQIIVPYSVEGDEGEAWVVARDGEAALFISLEFEQFGVGFLGEDGILGDGARYPDLAQAAQAFGWAVANSARPTIPN